MTSVAREVPRPDTHWESRPILADLLRGALLAVPLVSSVSVVYAVGALIPMEQERSWWALTVVLIAAVVTAVVTERVVQRLLPLTVLLQLTMLFPDRAPSRLRLARAAVVGPPTELFWSGAGATPTTTSDTVLALISALGAHDRRTRGHSERVRVLCDVLAQELKLDRAARDRLRWAALLHDVGKMAVSPSVLNKPAALNHDEFDAVREHPVMGASVSAPLLPWLGEWGRGILEHHERFDGSGYPSGISGHQISDAGRIIAIVDSFETMTAARAYKKPMATKAAREELARCAGTQFDPVYVRAFLAVSLPRMMWALGPLSFLVHAPFLRSIAEAGARSGAATGQAAASAAGVAVLATAGVGSLDSATADDPFPSAAPSSSIPFVQTWPGAEAPLTTAIGAQSTPIDLGVLTGSRSTEVPGGGAVALRTPGTTAPDGSGPTTGSSGSTGGPAEQAEPAPGSTSTRPPQPGSATKGETGKLSPDTGAPTAPGRDSKPNSRPDSSTSRPPADPPVRGPGKPPTKRPGLPELPVTVPDIRLAPADRRVRISGPDAVPAGGVAVFVLSTPARLPLQCRDTTDGRALGAPNSGWSSCASTVTFAGLTPGRYILQARSVDDGRTGAVSSHVWRVVGAPTGDGNGNGNGSSNGSSNGPSNGPSNGAGDGSEPPAQPARPADAGRPADSAPAADPGRPTDPGRPGPQDLPSDPGRPEGAGVPEGVVQGRTDGLEELPARLAPHEPAHA